VFVCTALHIYSTIKQKCLCCICIDYNQLMKKVFLFVFLQIFVTDIFSSGGNFNWVKCINDGTIDDPKVTTDIIGNIYYSGTFNGSVDFDPGPDSVILQAIEPTIFISKFNPNGALVWVKKFDGGNSMNFVRSVSVDYFGNILSCGTFTGTVDFGPGPGITIYSGYMQSYFVKIDSSGSLIWSKVLAGNDVNDCSCIKSDRANNVYITGSFEHTADFDPDSGSYNLNVITTTGYILKLDPSGSFLWARAMNDSLSPNSNEVTGIDIDNANNIYIIAEFRNSLDADFSTSVLTFVSTGGTDILFAKYDPVSNLLWAKSIGGQSSDYAGNIVIDNSGNVLFTGSYSSVVYLNPGNIASGLALHGNTNSLLLKTDPIGTIQWLKSFGGADISSLDIDNFNSIYISGVSFGTFFYPVVGGEDSAAPVPGERNFIASISSSGYLQYARRLHAISNGSAIAAASPLVIDASDAIIYCGSYHGAFDFDPGFGIATLPFASTTWGFIEKFTSPCLSPPGNFSLQGCDSINLFGIELTADSSFTETIASSSGCDSTISCSVTLEYTLLPSICVVSVDSLSTHNLIVYEKPPGFNAIDSFFIYREIGLNAYQTIGVLADTSYSIFHDYNSNPNASANKYKIAVKNKCGIETVSSLYHNTIHLQYLGLGNFQWNNYEIEGQSNPVLSYNFFRDDNSTGLFNLIQTIPGGNNSFTDVAYASFPNASYQVNVNWITPVNCNPTSRATASLYTSSSNILNRNLIGFQDEKFGFIQIYPNPTKEMVNINFGLNFLLLKNYSISVLNIIGENIINFPVEHQHHSIQTSEWNAGFYIISVVNTDDKVVFRKKVSVE
jgi:hypothetical protein